MEDQPGLRPSGALLLVLVQFAAYMSVWVLGAATAGGAPSLLTYVAASVVSPLMALFIGLNRYAPRERTRVALGLGRPRGEQVALVALALAVGAALAPVTHVVRQWIYERWPIPLPAGAEEAPAPGMVVLLLFVVGQTFAMPFVGEALFRGFLLPRLSATVGEARGFAVTLGLYVMAQVNPRDMPGALLQGGIMGALALRARNTWVPVTGGVAHQAALILLRWWGSR